MGGGERLGQPSVVLALPSSPAEFTLAICGVTEAMAGALTYTQTVLSQENICM